MSLWLGWCCCTKLWLFGLGWLHTGTSLLSLPVCCYWVDVAPPIIIIWIGMSENGMCLLSLPTCFRHTLDSYTKLYNKFFCWFVGDVTVNWLMLLRFMSLNCILKFLREAWGKFPGIAQGKEAEISTYKIPLHFPGISAGKSWEIFGRDDPLESPHKSAWKSGGRGWLARWVSLPVCFCFRSW